DRPNARCPAEGKREAQQKPAPDAGLRARAAQMNIAIQPARECRPQKSDDRKREEMHRAESGQQRAAMNQRNNAEANKNHSEDDSGAQSQFRKPADQVQPKQNNQRARDWRKRVAILLKDGAPRAGGSSEGNEHHRKADHEGKRRGKKAAARLLPLP